MRRLLQLMLIAVVVLLLPGCIEAVKARKTVNLSLDHIPASALAVNTRNGAISVIASDEYERVMIESQICCTGGTRAEAERRLAQSTIRADRDSSGRLVIAPVFPDQARGSDGAGITVRLPDAGGVTADTSNGSVTVHGVDGEVKIHTSNGAVTVEHVDGSLTVDTSNGAVTVRDHHGRAVIDTSNGTVRVFGQVGPLEADTSNGAVIVEDLAGSADIDTSNGAVQLTLRGDQSGPIDLRTSNGSVTIIVGPAFVGELSLHTSNGGFRINDRLGRIRRQSMEKHRANLLIGEGGPSSRASTSNGRVTLTIAD